MKSAVPHQISADQLKQLLQALGQRDDFVFLDTARPSGENSCSYLFVEPEGYLRYRVGEDRDLFLARLEDQLSAGFHLAGWMVYEFGYVLETSLEHLLESGNRPGDLLVEFGIYKSPLFFNHNDGSTTFPLAGTVLPKSHRVTRIRPNLEQGCYLEAIDRIKKYIHDGDTYQVNYTLKLDFDFEGCPENFYEQLRANQSVAYGAYLRSGNRRILSFSPELFFRKTVDSVTVRPMKGTLARGRHPVEDGRLADYLHNDEKNRSENVMIVDLLRNDLGRLMHFLSDEPVRTRSLFDVEPYETLFQMTSTIEARGEAEKLRDLSLLQLFKALFPCGSVTGAPKIRTMEIIHELEQEPRGVYTGAIGYLAPDGTAMFNVPIRTIELDGSRGWMGIGSGIINDSDAEQEWDECLLKGEFLSRRSDPFYLIETLLWEEKSGFWLLREHLERLRDSAARFLFAFDQDRVLKSLEEPVDSVKDSCCRVRLTLAKDGTLEVTTVPWFPPKNRCLPVDGAANDPIPKVVLSSRQIDRKSPFTFHKTSRRKLLNSEFERVRGNGFDDVLFFNEDDELTESAIANVIVESDGRFLTPSLSSGLLAGVMRRQLLDRGEVSETVISRQTLLDCAAIYLCNSVRGVFRVELVDAP
ncbi:MAG: aminodeoxychorismate synthase component I [Thermodesulfobacteriota bacterium]